MQKNLVINSIEKAIDLMQNELQFCSKEKHTSFCNHIRHLKEFNDFLKQKK